jgi:hypothetical protein
MTKDLELVDDLSLTKKQLVVFFSTFLCTLSEKMQWTWIWAA